MYAFLHNHYKHSCLEQMAHPLKLCKGKDTKGCGLGGLFKAHSILILVLFNNVCKISI